MYRKQHPNLLCSARVFRTSHSESAGLLWRLCPTCSYSDARLRAQTYGDHLTPSFATAMENKHGTSGEGQSLATKETRCFATPTSCRFLQTFPLRASVNRTFSSLKNIIAPTWQHPYTSKRALGKPEDSFVLVWRSLANRANKCLRLDA